ncbi:MAG TPA: hypothetical protein VFK44_05800 [Bacillales bacterium]|nr:hypothetical protein [Bacillales bacterium]
MAFSRSRVDLAAMKINNVGKGCTVTFSQKKLTGSRTSVKRSEGFGEENGDGCMFMNPAGSVEDGDIVDGSDGHSGR